MKKMPEKIKNKLRQYAKAQARVTMLHNELYMMFESYNVPYDNLTALSGDDKEPNTEGLAYINNGELDDLEETIDDIERVFLYFANKNLT